MNCGLATVAVVCNVYLNLCLTNLMQVNFYIRGPHGAGKVYCEMFKDQADKQWKYTYLIVEIKSPSPSQMILESYMPAYNVDNK